MNIPAAGNAPRTIQTGTAAKAFEAATAQAHAPKPSPAATVEFSEASRLAHIKHVGKPVQHKAAPLNIIWGNSPKY